MVALANLLKGAVLVFVVACLTACAADGETAAQAAEIYLQARTAGEEQTVRQRLCKAQEMNADQEVMTFSGLEAQTEGLVCTVVDALPDGQKVACTGEVIVSYGGEPERFPFVSYRMVQEDGLWKWCGETP
jgi:hypothetical protein